MVFEGIILKIFLKEPKKLIKLVFIHLYDEHSSASPGPVEACILETNKGKDKDKNYQM